MVNAMNVVKHTSSIIPSARSIVLPLIFIPEKLSRQRMISSNVMATERGRSFDTVDREMVIGDTMAAHPTMSRVLRILLPMTFPTAISAEPFNADVRLTNSSGADVPAATMVRPIIISGTCMRRPVRMLLCEPVGST